MHEQAHLVITVECHNVSCASNHTFHRIYTPGSVVRYGQVVSKNTLVPLKLFLSIPFGCESSEIIDGGILKPNKYTGSAILSLVN